MARSPAAILGELLAETPPGSALPHRAESNWGAFLGPIASAWSDAETLAEAMLPQVDPRAAPQFLADFERVLGPDPYGRDAPSQNLTTAQRAALTYQRWTENGNASVADYEALATAAGQTATITEFWPAMCGEAQCGTDLIADVASMCGWSECGEGIGQTPIAFWWLVGLPALEVTYAECGQAACGYLLGSYADNLMGAVIAGEAPAHTRPLFTYS